MWFNWRSFLEDWPHLQWSGPDLVSPETGEIVASWWKLARLLPWR
jgi:hypothetical protein